MKKILLATLFTTFAMTSQAGELNFDSAINSISGFLSSVVTQVPVTPAAPSTPTGSCGATHNWNTPCK